jgi:hypothetical protein
VQFQDVDHYAIIHNNEDANFEAVDMMLNVFYEWVPKERLFPKSALTGVSLLILLIERQKIISRSDQIALRKKMSILFIEFR